MATFFSGDWHLGHANVLKFCNRPFKDADEMNRAIVSNWNAMVTHEDTGYILGDLTLYEWGWLESMIWRFNGNLKVVPGNHDRRWIKSYQERGPVPKLEILPPLVSLRLPQSDFEAARIDQVPKCIVLCHYGMRVWDSSHRGSWMLFGHSHLKLPPAGLSFDVGVDGHEFRPWSLKEIATKMKTLKAFNLQNEEQDDKEDEVDSEL